MAGRSGAVLWTSVAFGHHVMPQARAARPEGRISVPTLAVQPEEVVSMFDESPEQPASEQPAPLGMRELPPQPARPVMPAYTLPSAAVARTEEPSSPSSEDSVIARDDHVEGTFTSRGTVVVMGSVKGRIEAVRLRIEQGASVDADVIVDEAIVAGEFTGNLTCRERLEARSSGRINGRVETFKLMLHEGASVEGEMHMLTERPRDASETIRGTAPLRGDVSEGKASPRSAGTASTAAVPSASTSAAPVPATRPAPALAPSSAAKASRGQASQPDPSGAPGAPAPSSAAPASAAPSQLPSVEAILAQRSTVAETLHLETVRVAPRATTSTARSSGALRTGGTGNGARGRNGTTTAF
jgi:cytoskeletal protein CcmA (bactofilin family)